MTKVKYNLVNGNISYIESKGHTGYAVHGKDIVCASISTAFIMSLNLLDRLNLIDKINYEIADGLITIEVLNVEEELLQQVLVNLIYTLKDLENEYPKNIKIYCIGG